MENVLALIESRHNVDGIMFDPVADEKNTTTNVTVLLIMKLLARWWHKLSHPMRMRMIMISLIIIMSVLSQYIICGVIEALCLISKHN